VFVARKFQPGKFQRRRMNHAGTGISHHRRGVEADRIAASVAVELTEAYLARIEALDHLLDSFVTLTADRARAEAKAAEASIMASGPVGRLHGIPYCLKDIFETAGIRTTAMSKLLANNVPTRDSFCQEKLVAPAACCWARPLPGSSPWRTVVGRAVSPGTQPLEPDHSPAGSSSGSGAAIAAGLHRRPWVATPADRSEGLLRPAALPA